MIKLRIFLPVPILPPLGLALLADLLVVSVVWVRRADGSPRTQRHAVATRR